ncbi:glycosyltransferase family 2 protein [Spongisporangium articulatum]|uniref:Glycosyltransferase family 2 protein n=1 Tax=Spongisporangium articulatum TaxID=3362603 RepID=A0ABW8ANB8_9ACTN
MSKPSDAPTQTAQPSEGLSLVSTKPEIDPLNSISVVVTHYKTPEQLATCLHSLKAIGGVSEVIVCDSEAEEVANLAVQRSGMEVSYRPFSDNVGFARLVNAGIADSQSEYVLVINADVLVNRDGLEKLLETLSRSLDIGIAVPRLLYPNGDFQSSVFRFYRPMTLLYRRTILGLLPPGQRELSRFEEPSRRAATSTSEMDVDWALGAAMLVRRKAITEVGAMDARYFLYFEDVDWCLRMWKKEWRVVFSPAATFVHNHGRASRKHGVFGLVSNPLLRTHLRSAALFFRSHGLKRYVFAQPSPTLDISQDEQRADR